MHMTGFALCGSQVEPDNDHIHTIKPLILVAFEPTKTMAGITATIGIDTKIK